MFASVLRRYIRTRAIAPWLVLIVIALASSNAFAYTLISVGGDSCTTTSLQTAIDMATDPEGNTIFVARNFTFSGQHLYVNNRKIAILGGLNQCTNGVYGDPTTISGTTGHSIFEIEGNSEIFLSKFLLTGADLDGEHKGGAIYFGGAGLLTLSEVTVRGNRAGYGGGIDMSPSGSATLKLLSSVISLNTASGQGGGIRLEGNSTLISDGNTYITGNMATGVDDVGYGGGVELVGPATANISSNLNNNTATYGGGVAALASGSSNARVNLYSTTGAAGTLYGNHATATGGGIYLKSSRDSGVATLCANSFSIDENTGTNGAAIFADADNAHGSSVYINSSLCPPPDGAAACVVGENCDDISRNVSSQSGSATVMIESNGALYANRFAARHNTSGRLMALIADTPTAALVVNECLLADNTLTSNLLWGAGGASTTSLFVHSCTLSNNTLGSSDPVIYADVSRLEISNSIIDQPNQSSSYAFTGSGGNLYTQYDLTNNTSAFSNGVHVMQGTPSFVDTSDGDYHLLRTSPGVDVAPSSTDTIDLDGNTRSIDLTDILNSPGPVDLGAYEVQVQPPPGACVITTDTVFCNEFEVN